MKEYWSNLTSGQKTKLILKIVLGIMSIVFIFQNWQSTTMYFVFFKLNIPLTLIIVLCIGVGFALSTLFDYRKFKSKDKEIVQLKSKISSLVQPIAPTNHPAEEKNME